MTVTMPSDQESWAPGGETLSGNIRIALLAWPSPIYGDLRGLPPTLIQVSGDELLQDDAMRMRDALRSADVTVRCEIGEGLWHGFHLNAMQLAFAQG
jgi:acetyl esterase/lipase